MCKSQSNTFKRRTLSKRCINYSLWLGKAHLSERKACSQQQMGRKKHRYQKTPLHSLITSHFLLTHSVLHWEKLEALTWWNQTPFGGLKKDPNTAVLLPQTWRTMRHPQSSWWARVDQPGPPFVCFFSLCPTSPPPQKSPVGLHYPLQILSVPKTHAGVLRSCSQMCDTISLSFVADNASRVHHSEIRVDSQTSAADRKDT